MPPKLKADITLMRVYDEASSDLALGFGGHAALFSFLPTGSSLRRSAPTVANGTGRDAVCRCATAKSADVARLDRRLTATGLSVAVS